MIAMSSIIQTFHDFYLIELFKLFFLAPCDDLVNLACIEYKETSLITPVSISFEIIDVDLSITS